MPGWEMKIITAEAERLLAMAVEDAGLREELRAWPRTILKATEAFPASDREGDESAKRPAPSPAQVGPAKAAEPLRELTFGRSRAAPDGDPAGRRRRPRGRSSPTPISPRSNPAAGSRRSVRAGRRPDSGGFVRGSKSRWRALPRIRRSPPATTGSTNHFYWMNSPGVSQPADISLLYDVGGCFETLAAAIALVMDNGTLRPGRLEQSLPLIVEAQSALRAAIQRIHGPDDPDQVRVFEWLKKLAAQHHVYVKRYMRADDLADPTRWRDLLDRIEKVDARYRQTRQRSQYEEASIDRLRRHRDLIREGKGTEAGLAGADQDHRRDGRRGHCSEQQ